MKHLPHAMRGRQRGAQAELTDGKNVLLLFGDLAVLQQQSSNGLENQWREGLAHSVPSTSLEPFTQVSQATLK